MLNALWLHRCVERFAAAMGARLSYAQEGEDLLLDRILHGRDRGFYVDVGAHHPWRFSNTARLHARGWRGINIDPEPGSMAAFRAARPRAINLEVAVGTQADTRRFFRYSEPALNGFEDRAAELAETPYRALGSIEVSVQPLREILAQHAPATGIDLLTIDVEGAELEVLESNDWSRWLPRLILIEARAPDFAAAVALPAVRSLTARGYAVLERCGRNLILDHASNEGAAAKPAASSKRRKAVDRTESSLQVPASTMRPPSNT